MIGRLLSKIFRGFYAGRSSSTAKKMIRRIAIEPLETRRLLAVTGSLSGFAYLDPQDTGVKSAADVGFAGLTVQLESVGSGGSLSSVTGAGPVQTHSDGSYSFTGLAAGAYQIQIEPSSKLAVGKLSPGSAGGAAGNDEIQVSLSAGQNATDYNFAILGAATDEISLRMNMASTGTLTQFLTSMHSKPTVDPGNSGSSTDPVNYTSGGAAAAIVPSATITAPDSPTLLSLTATIQDPPDGSSEQLTANTTGTSLASNYADGVLTVTGAADVPTYQTVLESVQYSDTAATVHAGARTVSIVVNDGTDASAPADVTIDVAQGTNIAPTVTTNPTSKSVTAGSSVTFTAAASGNPTPTVQWQMSSNGGTTFSTISGATSTSYTFTASSAESGDEFEAVFTNSVGTVTSTPATLTIETAPSVTTNPTSQTVNTGSSVSLTAAASGNPAPSVQWEVSTNGGTNFSVITGATSTTYTFTASGTENGDQYEAVFSNGVGAAATSSAATLTVDHVTNMSASQTVDSGATANFTAGSSNPSSTDTVQWKVSTNGSSTFSAVSSGSGATSTTYSFTASSGENSNQYEAVFSNSLGTFTSGPATLTVDFAPTVTTSPTSQTLNSGATVTFTAAASGNPVPAVQWQVMTSGGSSFSPISGATSTTYSFAASGAESGNQYEAVFTNSAGPAATTSVATLTVDSVTTQPASQTVDTGDTATFTAASSNPGGADTVQWKVSSNGGTSFTAVSGATSTTFSFTASSAENANQYEAVFSNTAGTLTSSPATLTVDSAPTVTTSPASQTVNSGGTAIFTAAASGNPAPAVQWQVMTSGGTSFSPISGATSTTYSFTATSGENGDQYEAVFSNSLGTIASSPATLTVDVAPAVTTSPASQTLNSGATVTFTAAASGNPAPTVQWKVSTNGGTAFSAISGATSTTYSFTATSGENGDEYEAVFSNTAGTIASSPATLTVDFPPENGSIFGPASQTVGAGDTATLTASASGNPAPTVQWQVSTDGGTTFSAISGATSTTYSFTAGTGDTGNEYEAVFTNSLGTLASNPTTLTVSAGPIVTLNPVSQTVNAGSGAVFTAAASGSPAPTVQWKVSSDGGTTFSAISGATSTTYSFTASGAENGDQYEAVFSNAAGATSVASLTVDYVKTEPANQTAAVGATATFTATSSNPSGADIVQWEVSTDGGTSFSAVSGATSTTYSFTATNAESGNRYEAIFTNSLGSFTSGHATLTVQAGAGVTTNPVSQTVNAGATVTFTAAATANPTPTVQWDVSTDGGSTFGAISGATSTTYSFTASGTDNDAQYEAVFTNSAGTLTSSAATLSVDYVKTQPDSQSVLPGQTATFTAATSDPGGADTVKWNVSSDSGSTFTAITGATSTTYSFAATSADSGDQYEAVFTNSAGTLTSSQATLTVTSVTADQTALGPSNDTAAGFTINGATSGTTFTYSVQSSGGGAPVTGSGLLTATSQDITGIDVSALPAGTLTYTVTLAGDSGSHLTATVPLKVIPSNYTIVASPATIMNAADTDAGFTFTGAQTGTTYSYTITDSQSGKVTGTGSVTSAAQEVTGVDVTSLANGTLTYSVVLTDEGGDAGAAATATATLSVLSVTSTPATTATVNQTYSYTVQTNAPGGDTVTVAAASGTTLPGNMTLTGSTVTWTPTSGEAGTSPSFTLTVTDSTTGNVVTVGPIYVAVAAANGLTVLAPPATLAIGSPALIAVDDAAAEANFSVQTSNSNVTATFLPTNNPILQVKTNLGEMDFQLFNNYTPNTVSHFTSLVDSNAYSSTSFYRVIQNFVIQGGTGGTGSTIPVELNPNLQFTTSGLLAMANNGEDGNSSEFFITGPDDVGTTNSNFSDGFLDFRYTIFGKLISGDNVRQAIANTPVQGSQPVTPVTIESVDIINPPAAGAPDDGVLILSAASGATGNYNVTVSDGLGNSQTFSVAIGSDPYGQPNPWVQPVNGTDSVSTAYNTPATFTAQGESADGSPVQVNAQLLQPVPAVPGAFVDTTYTPTLEGSFNLQVGSQTTTSINFDSTDIPQTALAIQVALGQLPGLSAATVTAVAADPTDPGSYSFDVTFAGSEPPISFVTAGSTLGATFANSAATAAATQELTFTNSSIVADTVNPNMTITENSPSGGSSNAYSYTVTPNSGFYGATVMQVTAVVPISGTFTLQVGSQTTGSINFDSTDLAATAANIQNALDQLPGLSGTIVTPAAPIPNVSPTDFEFNVTFASAQADVTYVASSTALPVTFSNPIAVVSATQILDFNESSPGTSWDTSAGVDPVYRAYVPVFVAPPTPQIESISVNGQTVSGSTSANNSTVASELAFDVSGVVSGATVTVSVELNGVATTIATGKVATGDTTITVTSDGTVTLPAGGYTFTVAQSVATSAMNIYANWAEGSSGFAPKVQFSIPANTVNSAASAGTAISIVAPTAAPSGYQIAASPTTINGTSAGFTFSGATTGLVYNYSVSSSGGGTAVSGSGTVTSATQQVAGIDVSTLPNGTLTFSVTLTFDADDTGAAATATAILDAVAPSGYSISPEFSTISAGQASSTGFLFADATVGTTYNFTVTSSGGTSANPVTGSGNVTSASQEIGGIDVSSLPAGTLTYSVTLSNGIDNTGAAATATATLDT